jgi:hypothetical protein
MSVLAAFSPSSETAVGLRMVARSTIPALAPSEHALLLITARLFSWGFSQRKTLKP